MYVCLYVYICICIYIYIYIHAYVINKPFLYIGMILIYMMHSFICESLCVRKIKHFIHILQGRRKWVGKGVYEGLT